MAKAKIVSGLHLLLGAVDANGDYSAPSIDISDHISVAMVHLEHPEIPIPYVHGEAGQIAEVSPNYMATLTVNYISNQFTGTATAGANFDLDALMRSLLPTGSGGYGTGSSDGRFSFLLSDSDGAPSATNPHVSGVALHRQWDIFGSGTPNQILQQNITHTITGGITLATS